MNSDLRIPSGLRRIPDDRGGIYAFHLRIPESYELGIDKSSSIQELLRAKKNLLTKIDRISVAYKSTEWFGVLAESKASHIAVNIEASVATCFAPLASEIAAERLDDQVSAARFLNYLNTLREYSVFFPPLYVGICIDQSLRTRIKQHYAGNSNVDHQLKGAKLTWADVVASFVPVLSEFRNDQRNLEKVIQHIIGPRFSRM